MNQDSKSFLMICQGLIVLGILFLYYPLFFYGWLQIEDGEYYLRNSLLGEAPLLDRLSSSWTTAPESNWIPLTWGFTIALKELFGLHAGVFHLSSVFFHCLNSLLVFRVIQKLGFSGNQACLVTCVFAFHPLQVESVAWVSSLKGVLSASFAFGALLLVVEGKVRYRRLMGCLLFVMSLLCKQTLLALPAILCLLDSHDVKGFVERLLSSWYLLLLGVCGGIAAYLSNQNNPNTFSYEEPWMYFVKGFVALGHYVKVFCWPFGLHPEYAYEESSLLLALIGGGAVLASVSLLFFSPRYGRASLACLILLFPVLGFWPSPLELAADRLMYVPIVFVAIVVGGITDKVRDIKLASLIVCLVAVTLAGISRQQLKVWQSDFSLCQHTLQHTPHHYLAKLNLGLLRAREGEFDEAEKILRESVQEHPERVQSARSLSQVLIAKGEGQEALQFMQELVSDQPEHTDYRIILAQTYHDLGYMESAISTYQEVLELDERSLKAVLELVRIYLSKGEKGLARSYIEKAVVIAPRNKLVKQLSKKF